LPRHCPPFLKAVFTAAFDITKQFGCQDFCQ
jgi:hypothetical protein